MKRIIFFLLLIFVLGPFQATAKQWKLDTVHTNFYFDIKHTYATVRGQFLDFTGDVFFDPGNLDKSRFDFVIKVDTVDTKIGKRDTHLRSPDFFDAAKYPVMTFKSSKVTKGEGSKIIVEGTLTIKDVSKEIALEFDYHGQKENPVKKGEIIAGFDAKVTIDRLAYNVGDGKFYNIGVIEKDVDILITLELLRNK
jgi:polyisoprenoid-binding protein YceI